MPNKTKHSDAQKKLARLKLSPVAIQLLTGLLHDTGQMTMKSLFMTRLLKI